MSKRFTLEYETDELCQIYENDNCMSVEDVVDLLNELHEENLHLAEDNQRMVKFIRSKGYILKDYLQFIEEEIKK